jgi:U2-associated protein SR140
VDENIDGVAISGSDLHSAAGGFVKSKWEELDPEQVAHQAITTSKWDLLNEPVAPEPPKISSFSSSRDDLSSESDDSREGSDEKRKRLREIEVKTLEYQEEIEAGDRSLKSGWSMRQQVEHYRKKLLKRVERNDSDSYASSSSRRERDSSERSLKRPRKSISSERERSVRAKRSRSTSRTYTK